MAKKNKIIGSKNNLLNDLKGTSFYGHTMGGYLYEADLYIF